jgi:hypothetical protein
MPGLAARQASFTIHMPRAIAEQIRRASVQLERNGTDRDVASIGVFFRAAAARHITLLQQKHNGGKPFGPVDPLPRLVRRSQRRAA